MRLPRRLLPAAITTVAVAAALPAAAHASSAVVLVSGFDTATPFTTSAPTCAGQEGHTWGDPNGPAAALKAAGLTVFTAPVAQGGGDVPPPCLGTGQVAPPVSDAIDSNGELDANGAAFASFLQFLQASYGVTSVQIVGHSDGGLWSRSAITQLPATAGITVQSLTTLATPHTGSFGADLAETLTNEQCDFSNDVEEAICDVALVAVKAAFDDVGATTVRELSSTFLEGWNPQQTIGCQVTTMAGTFVDIPLVDFEYYNPDDGIVGEGSALNVDTLSVTLSDIPAANFTPIGNQTFPVVHSSVLSFLSPNTMLNQSDISAAVVSSVQANASTTPCLAASGATARSAAGDAVATPRQGSAGPIRAHAGFRSLEVPRRGRLAEPVRGETVLLLGKARVSCAGERLTSVPVLGSRRLSMAVPTCEQPLRVRGKALALRPSGDRSIAATRDGGTLKLRTRGAKLRAKAAEVRVDGGPWKALPLRKATRVPADAELSVRVSGRDRSGERHTATAHLAS